MLTTVAVVAGLAIGVAIRLRSQRLRDTAPVPLHVPVMPRPPLAGTRYERMGDPRRTARRVADDRRDGIRFENGRRQRPDRRMPNTVWDQAQ